MSIFPLQARAQTKFSKYNVFLGYLKVCKIQDSSEPERLFLTCTNAIDLLEKAT